MTLIALMWTGALAAATSTGVAADCLQADYDNSPETIVAGRVIKRLEKKDQLSKDSELRLAKTFFLKLDPPLRADNGTGCDNWDVIAIVTRGDQEGARIAKLNNRRVIIEGKLGRFGSALVYPSLFIEVATIKVR
jgi:hypothetical protein